MFMNIKQITEKHEHSVRCSRLTRLSVRAVAAALALSVVVSMAGCGNEKNEDVSKLSDTSTSTAKVSSSSEAAHTAAARTVVGAVDLDYYNQLPENAVPDMYYWGDGRVQYLSDPSDNDSGIYKYAVDAETVELYVAMLQDNGFTLVDTYNFSYKGTTLTSWGFTCDAAADAETITLMYEKTPCHISLYYADDPGEYTMQVSPDLLPCDTGLRYDGSVVDLRPKGPSAGAGLVQLPDGSYQTSDGRLTASLGTATILRDGVVYTANARYNTADGEEELQIENYYRNEGIYFQAPKASLMQGDIFTPHQMRRWRWTDRTGIADLSKSLLGNQPLLALPYDGKWLGASYNETLYEDQTVRVMLYDSGNIGVFYIYSKTLKDKPTEVEALCVVSMTERKGTLDEATYVKAGNVATVKYGYHEFGTMWETYSWVILEGADKISIETTGNTCDVTCHKPGVAAVQVTYSYSKEEPDVLTDIMRTVDHNKVQVYYFIIE